MLFPSTYPSFANSWASAKSRDCGATPTESTATRRMRCCAFVARGQMVAAPPRSAINSRRLIVALEAQAGTTYRTEPSSTVGRGMSALGQKADICSAKRHVRFTPESGHVHCTAHVLQAKASAIKDKLVRRQKFYIQFTFGAARSVVQAFQGQPAAAEPSQCGSWWSTF